MEHSFII